MRSLAVEVEALVARHPLLASATGPTEPTEAEARAVQRDRWKQRMRLMRTALRECGVPVGMLDAREELAHPAPLALLEEAAESGLWLAAGQNGRGKSYWSVLALRRRLRERVRRTCYDEPIDIDLAELEQGRPDYHAGAKWTRLDWIVEDVSQAIHERRTQADALQPYRAASWLCLAAVLSGNVTAFACSTLFDIIDRRMTDGLPTVLTLDRDLDELHAKLGEHGDRVLSRLQRFQLVTFTGSDRRRPEPQPVEAAVVRA